MTDRGDRIRMLVALLAEGSEHVSHAVPGARPDDVVTAYVAAAALMAKAAGKTRSSFVLACDEAWDLA